jgi:hypothetical protein
MARSVVRGMALVVAATLTVPGVAMAQAATVPAAPAMAEQAPPPAPGPSLWVVGGITTFAFSYVPAAVVAATSPRTFDRTLLVPVLGPWIDLTQRPACPSGVCPELAPKGLLILDGALQTASVLAVVFGLVSASPASATMTPSASLKPTIRLSPAPVGASGHGMVALGTF